MARTQFVLQNNSDFMNKIEANDQILIVRHTSQGLKVIVEKKIYFVEM